MNKQIRIWIEEVSNGKTIIVSKEIKIVHPLIDRIVRNLAQIDIIRYIKIRPDFLAASNEIKGGSRDPVAEPHHPTATGVSVIVDFPQQYVQFYEMNAARKGYGQKMVDAVLNGAPRRLGGLHSDGLERRLLGKDESQLPLGQLELHVADALSWPKQKDSREVQ